MWLFTERVSLAFENMIWPLLGIVFLPLTTFTYIILWDPVAGISGVAWAAVVVTLFIDIALNAGTIYGNRKRVLSRE
jgi:hypothetical protein